MSQALPARDHDRFHWARGDIPLVFALSLLLGCSPDDIDPSMSARPLTCANHPHVLTNVNVFTPDSKWIVYDIRSQGGNAFDGDRIERIHVESRTVEVVYQALNGAGVGVATCHPTRDEVVCICGPEHPTPDFTYGAARRQGVILDPRTFELRNLDARDLSPPFTPGALRGGTHLHVYSPDGALVSSTYEDHVLESAATRDGADPNQRTLAVSVLGQPVSVDRDHPRNHDGTAFTVVVTATVNQPTPGSDQINRAFEEAWIGTDGYVKADGSRQRRALAFQGNVVTGQGRTISEVFLVDLPDDLTLPGSAPLEGTATTRPAPPRGCVQRRLTFTANRAHPGIQGPRHWLRSAPDGSRIAFLMKDDMGIVQLFTVRPIGGPVEQLTRNTAPIASAFTWSPDGNWIAHLMDHRVCVTDTRTGTTHPLTPRADDPLSPTPHAFVFSPNGKQIAFLAPTVPAGPDLIWLVDFTPPAR